MPFRATHLSLVVAVFTFLSSGLGEAQTAGVALYPANRAVDINPDTHLVITFPSPPTIGKSGLIRIYDAGGHHLVDTLDLSIPACPDPSRRVAAPPATGIPLPASIPTSPTTTTPAVRMTPADLHDYQLTTIGGLDDFHFYPIIVHDNAATIYPHNHVLRYGHRYIVQIDRGVLNPALGGFAGFTTDKAWTFRTKKRAPPADAARVVVAPDGSGDFNTVQGAIDFVPDHPPHRVTIFIKNGTYEEIVFFRTSRTSLFAARAATRCRWATPTTPRSIRPAGPEPPLRLLCVRLRQHSARELLSQQLCIRSGRRPSHLRPEKHCQPHEYQRLWRCPESARRGLPLR